MTAQWAPNVSFYQINLFQQLSHHKIMDCGNKLVNTWLFSLTVWFWEILYIRALHIMEVDSYSLLKTEHSSHKSSVKVFCFPNLTFINFTYMQCMKDSLTFYVFFLYKFKLQFNLPIVHPLSKSLLLILLSPSYVLKILSIR